MLRRDDSEIERETTHSLSLLADSHARSIKWEIISEEEEREEEEESLEYKKSPSRALAHQP